MHHKGKQNINFVTDYDPGFPDINRILSKHKHILDDDDQCRTIFPQNCFRVAHRRGHTNLKEWLAPSNVRFMEVTGISNDEPNPGCTKCGKCWKDPKGRERASGIYNCQVMKEAKQFNSKASYIGQNRTKNRL